MGGWGEVGLNLTITYDSVFLPEGLGTQETLMGVRLL